MDLGGTEGDVGVGQRRGWGTWGWTWEGLGGLGDGKEKGLVGRGG